MNEANAGQAVSALSGSLKDMPQWAMTWNELTAETRMERLREEARALRIMVTELRHTVQKLANHQHAQDGTVLTPLRRDDDRPRGYVYDPLK